MQYRHFLFSQIFYSIFPNEIEYDVIFYFIESLWDEYETSNYNLDTVSEYSAIESFIKAKNKELKSDYDKACARNNENRSWEAWLEDMIENLTD